MNKKIIALFLIMTFLSYTDAFLFPQSREDFETQFQTAKDQYKKEQYISALGRLERLVGVIGDKQLELKDILGRCHLLLAAIYEKQKQKDEAERNYKLAKEKNVSTIDELKFEKLKLYKKYFNNIAVGKKKKKFPWLIVGGVVVVGIILYFVLKKKKKPRYTLTVNVGEGIDGTPPSGTNTYDEGFLVSYGYTARTGFGNLRVLLDGNEVEPSGTITMDRNHTLTVTTEAVGFETDRDSMEIQERQQGTFNVRLTARPGSDVQVLIQIDPTDPSYLEIVSDPNLLFTTENWNTDQPVTLKVNEDNNITPEDYIVRISAPAANLPEKTVAVRALDGDDIDIEVSNDDLLIQEGQTVEFRVRLSKAPPEDVTLSLAMQSGDDAFIVRPASLTFTTADFGYQTVEIEARRDENVSNETAVYRISSPVSWLQHKDVTVTSNDIDQIQFITNVDELTIQEGKTASFQVKLSKQPDGDVQVTVDKNTGTADIIVESGANLTFERDNYNVYQTVVLKSNSDTNVTDDTAIFRISADAFQSKKDILVTEDDKDVVGLDVTPTELAVEEKGSAEFQVRLTAQPPGPQNVNIAHSDGDEDITVLSASTLQFDATNWDTYQNVTLGATGDEDAENGLAYIDVTLPDVETVRVRVTETDTGEGNPPTIALNSPQNDATVYDDVSIRAVASDDYGIKMVEFWIDNEVVHTDYPDPGAVSEFIWPTKTVDLGPHQIKVIAYDTLDHTDELEISVTVEDRIPEVEVDSLGTSPVSGTVSIPVRASDYRGVQSIRFYLDDTELTPWEDGPEEQVSFNFILDTTLYANGTYTFRAVAVDTSGQESEATETDRIEIVIEN